MSKTIFTACLGTETNSFSPIPTGMDLFRRTMLVRGGRHGDSEGNEHEHERLDGLHRFFPLCCLRQGPEGATAPPGTSREWFTYDPENFTTPPPDAIVVPTGPPGRQVRG
jgi:hypothetical protein